ncbi:hypothetical protein [Puia dinghuensis]|uniref:Tetratricopeptide repeat protein n=1 Tax=Puia dinghuensis TaxID=1792502 RepID=A0A8J2UF87_9BACT|nr:hypothetical protein [Puia dinghuensis]GGB08834.1 hypothetical protein GCM10011511_35420 [Puia dinghuensis]
MKLLYSLSLAGTILFASCHNSLPAISLTETTIYTIDTVRMAAAGGDEKAARQKLEEAAALYKKDSTGGIRLYKSAILLKPTAKAYFDLAGALLATRQYNEGIQALSIAEKLGYTPLANVMFRYAYAYAHRPAYQDDHTSNDAHAIHYMELAIQMGYAHPNQFLQQSLFPNEMRLGEFQAVFVNALSGGAVKDPGKSLWDAYTGQFPEVQLPLTIDRSWISNHPYNENVNYIDFQYEKFIPDMRSAHFSREGGEVYYYVATIQKSPAYVALLYCEQYESDGGADTASIPLYTLATYDHQGKIVDRMPVAGQAGAAYPFMVFSIQPSLQFRVQEYTHVFKNNPDSAGYDNNPIIREDPQTPKDFHIAANGKLEQLNAPMALR